MGGRQTHATLQLRPFSPGSHSISLHRRPSLVPVASVGSKQQTKHKAQSTDTQTERERERAIVSGGEHGFTIAKPLSRVDDARVPLRTLRNTGYGSVIHHESLQPATAAIAFRCYLDSPLLACLLHRSFAIVLRRLPFGSHTSLDHGSAAANIRLQRLQGSSARDRGADNLLGSLGGSSFRRRRVAPHGRPVGPLSPWMLTGRECLVLCLLHSHRWGQLHR